MAFMLLSSRFGKTGYLYFILLLLSCLCIWARFNHFDDYKLIQHKHNTYKTKFKLNDYKLSFLRLFRSISSSMWMATYSSKDNSSKNSCTSKFICKKKTWFDKFIFCPQTLPTTITYASAHRKRRSRYNAIPIYFSIKLVQFQIDLNPILIN